MGRVGAWEVDGAESVPSKPLKNWDRRKNWFRKECKTDKNFTLKWQNPFLKAGIFYTVRVLLSASQAHNTHIKRNAAAASIQRTNSNICPWQMLPKKKKVQRCERAKTFLLAVNNVRSLPDRHSLCYFFVLHYLFSIDGITQYLIRCTPTSK